MRQMSQVYSQWLSVRRVCSLFDSLDLTELICCFIHLLASCGLAMLLPLFFSCIAGRVRDIVGQQRDENENEIKIP